MTPQLNPTASALPRLFACLASGLLKQTEYRTDYADQGHGRHADMEQSIVAGDLSRLPEKVLALVEGLTVRAEVSVVYDVSDGTARELGAQLGRAYGTLGPYEIPGTIDMLAVGDGRVVVGDWKGWEEVDHPDSNRQTLLYALAAALIYKVAEVTVVIAYLVAGHRDVMIATLDIFELRAFGDELKELYARAMKASANPHAFEVVGGHCKYCPAFGACHAQQQLADDVKTNIVASKFNSLIPFETDEEAADAYELAIRIGLLYQRVRGALAARAKERPIPLRNGKMYGEVSRMGNRVLDADKTYAYLRDKYGQEFADAALKREATQTWIENAFRKFKIKNPVKNKDEVVAELTKLGAVAQKRKVELDEFDPPQLAGAR